MRDLQRAVSVSADDGLKLRNARIANAVKCVPPQNKPLPAEIRTATRIWPTSCAGLRACGCSSPWAAWPTRRYCWRGTCRARALLSRMPPNIA